MNEFMGKGDGTRVSFETPFSAKEARGLHIMRDFIVLAPDNQMRVVDPDGNLLRDEPDGYHITKGTEDGPVVVTFDKAPALGVRVSCSVLGRKPEKGEALKVLPMTDTLAKQLDEKMPPALRQRKRSEIVALPAVQDMYREAYNRLVVDCHGFTDEGGEPLVWDEFKVKKALLDTLGSILLGGFAADRARTLQRERQTGQADDLSD